MSEVSREPRSQDAFCPTGDAGGKARRVLPASLDSALGTGPERGVSVWANRDAFDMAGIQSRVGVVHGGRGLSATVLEAEGWEAAGWTG